ncbi:uncharacterized protein LOC129910287 [Episyrphus balteatus]|uniref:uncharacterized protein LOC129910287 n=1 Tax=Episyrphus balteatus TaxID=286459 RepID=UPI0024856571|nr:uncharacterized protein LOC129910287 [Episyrphus balteatus]
MSMGLSMLFTVLGLLLAAAGILDAAPAPYQELLPRAGYVPVYIREGETPLSEIHPKLAEAFHEVEHKDLSSDNSNSESTSDELNSSKSNEEQSVPEVPSEPLIDISSNDSNKKLEESKEPNQNVVEAAKEAIKELVSVFENEMLDKLGLGEDIEDSKPSEADKKPQQISIESQKTDENIDNKPSSASSEKASDVLTVEAFKAKDFNKESIKDAEMDVPEDVPSEQ